MTLIIFSLLYSSGRMAYLNFNDLYIIDGPFAKSSDEMFNFISNHTDYKDIIVFFKPRILTLLTGRQSIMISNVDQLDTKLADYLVMRKSRGIYDPIDNYDQISLYSEEFLRIAGELPIVFENAGFVVFQLRGLAKAD
jgi:hypothetical protein